MGCKNLPWASSEGARVEDFHTPGYKDLSHENGLKFFKKVSIFPWNGRPKKGLRFLRGVFHAAFSCSVLAFIPNASSNPLLIK